MKTTMKKALVLITTAILLASTAMPAAAATTVALKSISLTLNKKTVTSTTLNVGKTAQLSVTYNPSNTTVKKTVTWKSSNTAIATVSGGKITAKKPGTATITATSNGKSATCKVTVKAPLTKIALNKTSITLAPGTVDTLTVSYTPSNTTDSKTVKWTSSNTKVATISGGKVTAVAAGTATITAKVGTKTATCKITVNKSASGFVDTTACYTTLNTYRKNAKLANLKKDANLEKYAQTRAKEIVKSFSHTRPNGTQGLKIIPGNLYKGENIAKGQKDCASVMKAWYNSAGHKANMLNKNFTKVGIVGYKYNGIVYWVQLFSS